MADKAKAFADTLESKIVEASDKGCRSVQVSVPSHIEDTAFILEMLQEAGYTAKVKNIEDWRDGSYKQLNINW